MEITTQVRRITRASNRHARSVTTRNANVGMVVYFDQEGREVYHHPASEIAPLGKGDLCPWRYTTKRTVRWHQPVTYADVADALENDPSGIFA